MKFVTPFLSILLAHALSAASVQDVVTIIHQDMGMRKMDLVRMVNKSIGDEVVYSARDREWLLTVDEQPCYLSFELKKGEVVGMTFRSTNFPADDYPKMEPAWEITNQIYQGVLTERGFPTVADEEGAEFPAYDEVFKDLNANARGLATDRRRVIEDDLTYRLVVWHQIKDNFFTPLFAIYKPTGQDAIGFDM